MTGLTDQSVVGQLDPGRVRGFVVTVSSGSRWTESPSTSSMRDMSSGGIFTPLAPTLLVTCSGRDAPTSAAATLSFCSTQAMASWAIVMPSSSAIGRSP